MIGIYGVYGRPGLLSLKETQVAFQEMTRAEVEAGATREELHGEGFSVGIVKRAGHHCRDLALSRSSSDLSLVMWGYARFHGETDYQWAEETIGRVARVYVEQGVGALTSLRGCFSLCIVHHGDLLLMEDRFGTKPLYYADTDRAFAFAPKVGHVVSSGLVGRERDLDAVKQVLAAGFFLGDRTLVRGVRRFPYGTMMIKRMEPWQSAKAHRYWEMPARGGATEGPREQLVDELWERSRIAVDALDRLDGTAAVPLSGGLDSRCIASFVSRRRPLVTITYDSGDEVRLAKKVSVALGAKQTCFSNRQIATKEFRCSLVAAMDKQDIHAVVNQYFYSPLFKQYFERNPEVHGIYDGVYLDILFSAPYTYTTFGPEECAAVYGRASKLLAEHTNMSQEKWKQVVLDAYEECCGRRMDWDGVGKSQLMYLVGRLRRYVNECSASRENYGYVLRPGYDETLCDFGYGLDLRLRKGILYLDMLKKHFPLVMKIQYKDSYGNRRRTASEKIANAVVTCRMKISNVTNGLCGYHPFQANYYFSRLRGIVDHGEYFRGTSYIDEIIDQKEMRNLFEKVKTRQYLLGLFQRLQFCQQFYRSNGF